MMLLGLYDHTPLTEAILSDIGSFLSALLFLAFGVVLVYRARADKRRFWSRVGWAITSFIIAIWGGVVIFIGPLHTEETRAGTRLLVDLFIITGIGYHLYDFFARNGNGGAVGHHDAGRGRDVAADKEGSPGEILGGNFLGYGRNRRRTKPGARPGTGAAPGD